MSLATLSVQYCVGRRRHTYRGGLKKLRVCTNVGVETESFVHGVWRDSCCSGFKIQKLRLRKLEKRNGASWKGQSAEACVILQYLNGPHTPRRARQRPRIRKEPYEQVSSSQASAQTPLTDFKVSLLEPSHSKEAVVAASRIVHRSKQGRFNDSVEHPTCIRN